MQSVQIWYSNKRDKGCHVMPAREEADVLPLSSLPSVWTTVQRLLLPYAVIMLSRDIVLDEQTHIGQGKRSDEGSRKVDGSKGIINESALGAPGLLLQQGGPQKFALLYLSESAIKSMHSFEASMHVEVEIKPLELQLGVILDSAAVVDIFVMILMCALEQKIYLKVPWCRVSVRQSSQEVVQRGNSVLSGIQQPQIIILRTDHEAPTWHIEQSFMLTHPSRTRKFGGKTSNARWVLKGLVARSRMPSSPLIASPSPYPTRTHSFMVTLNSIVPHLFFLADATSRHLGRDLYELAKPVGIQG
ncbi:hypothetical protein L227DRAFT_568395 [Lentinus tigrinus ALCF2SS1-6]|uniref:Uncharacterized protein n=1 Tax=Lentinus tigrinus ALCF2SS1-6 TaxID=1328759 RepID=A0A5C2RNM8_9APHY|nr:hypothetical protein L227DRAFT_568395 [Lentinus tigrinus ALCF2SS1-6]